MQLLDLTLPTPAENVALDEALLDAAEAGELADEVLRLWEPAAPLVAVGRASRVREEVNVEACRAEGVPILRRASGGAAIAAAPGCLMYAVVLRYEGREHLRMIDQTHRHVLGILSRALAPLVPGVQHLGTSDLALNVEQASRLLPEQAGRLFYEAPRKCSGNSLRCKRGHLLYHGTLLYAMDLALIARLLGTPPRQPEYRGGRDHASFVANLPLDGNELRAAVIAGFDAAAPLDAWPRQRTAQLVADRYGRDTWNLER